MTPQLANWNGLPRHDAEAEVIVCCGSPRWASELAARRPFADLDRLYDAADAVWWALERADWLAAFWSAVTGYEVERVDMPGNEFWLVSAPAAPGRSAWKA